MLVKTRGIIFRVVKYRETSIITNLYTEEFGLSSYIVNNVRSPKSKFNIGYFEPLNLVEIIAYHKPNRDIDRITEIKTTYPLHDIRQDMQKSAMIIFLAEVLDKCIIEHDKNDILFAFLTSAIKQLENSQGNNSFHLQFLFKLSSYLGFGINDSSTFIKEAINSQYYDNHESILSLQQLIEKDISESPSISSLHRKVVLNDLIQFYHVQIGMPQPKSLEVLNTVFN